MLGWGRAAGAGAVEQAADGGVGQLAGRGSARWGLYEAGAIAQIHAQGSFLNVAAAAATYVQKEYAPVGGKSQSRPLSWKWRCEMRSFFEKMVLRLEWMRTFVWE